MVVYFLLESKKLNRTRSSIADSAQVLNEDHPQEDIEVSVLLTRPRFVFGLMSQMFITMSIQYLAPVLAIHLHQYGYSAEQIGCAYGIPAILYATTCPFMYLMTQRMKKRGIIVIGFVMITVAMLMIGGSDSIIEFQKQPVFIFLGLCIIGLSAGMVSIPVLPEMLECVADDEELSGMYNMETIENVISGLFISFQSIGEAIGPVVSSYLTHHLGFQISQEIYAGILTLFFVAYFLMCGGMSIFAASDKH